MLVQFVLNVPVLELTFFLTKFMEILTDRPTEDVSYFRYAYRPTKLNRNLCFNILS